jgi:phospholipid transport system substrate-binding protein
MTMKRLMQVKLAVASLVLGALAVASAAQAQPERTPEQVIRDASDLAMEAIENRREELQADREALFGLIDEILLPRWDRQYTGQLVMGRFWREATPEQREAFINGLYSDLVDTYGEAILQYDSDRLRIRGTRGNLQEGPVMVDTEVRLENGTPVPISYRLRIQDGEWKVYDVVIEGRSYVTAYREQYAREFRAKGVDGVIRELRGGNTAAGGS